MKRSRILYSLLILVTVALGLLSRYFSKELPAWVNLYAGDALWALMVFWGTGFIFRTKSSLWVAAVAVLFSYGIEFSQLYHSAWIDAVRQTRIGGLILGFGFLWSDLASYFAGIFIGVSFEYSFVKKKNLIKNSGVVR